MNAGLTTKTIPTESDMLALGRDFAAQILASATPHAIFELVGDVGTGKTTFTRGLAAGLGISEPVTSPSFTISKRYAFPINPQTTTTTPTATAPAVAISGQLIHYDFYRLDDPGIMRDELAEALSEPNTVIVVEWGGDVADLLPADKTHLELTLQEDGSRLAKITSPAQPLTTKAQSPATTEPQPSTPLAEEVHS